MASQPEAEELTTVVGGSRSSASVGYRETLMEDKKGVAIIYKDSTKTFRFPRMRPKHFASRARVQKFPPSRTANHRRFQTKTVCVDHNIIDGFC